ncbi:MAG: transglycosylase domain-containing protein, partial [Caldilineaceae bacterium]
MSGTGMMRKTILPLLLIAAILIAACSSRPPVPKAAVRLTLTIDSLFQAYGVTYDLSERAAGDPQQIAETYLRRFQPGPLPRVFEHSVITDRNGTWMGEWVDEGRRIWVPIDQISPYLIEAIVATEDASFFDNQGIDARRLVAAVMQNAESGDIVSGASTITMQLARNLFFSTDLRFSQSVERKAFEALLAQDLSELYTKNEILEMYLNLIYFGHNAYGVEAAAQTFFNKSAADLNMAEAALIAGTPQAPARYDPINSFIDAKLRQRIVLNLLVRHGYLVQSEADDLYAQTLSVAADPDLRVPQARHFVQFLREEVQARLGTLNADRAGLHITASLDLPMQALAEEIVARQVSNLRPAYDLSNAALVAMQPGTGQIMVMVGSANFDDESIDGKVNVATSLRQPGSSIKPMLYATALNDNLISPSTVLWDLEVEYDISEDETYKPQNYDEKFHGPVTARTAVANSYNIPAVKLLDQVGVQRMLDMSRAMGLSSLRSDAVYYGLSLTLGGGEVRLLDLATAYHTIANQGAYIPYRPVVAIHDGTGNPIDLFPTPAPVQVLTPASAYQTTSIMSDNVARAPVFGENSLLKLVRPAAGKTGTTTSYRDNWTMGFSKYLVVGVWAGNSDGRPMRGVTGVTGAGPIWNEFHQKVISGTTFLETLGATNNPADWEFARPSTANLQSIECPRSLKCPNSLEVFSRAWLATSANTGVQSDSVMVRDRVMAVALGGNYVGYCHDAEQGQLRTLYRLPEGIGELRPLDALTETTRLELAIAPQLPVGRERTIVVKPISANVVEQVEDERKEVLRWARINGEYLHLGPCDSVQPLVQAIYGQDAVASLVSPAPSAELDPRPALAEGDIISDTLALTGTEGLSGTVVMAPLTPEEQAALDAAAQQAGIDPQATQQTISNEEVAPPTGQYVLTAAGPTGGCSGNYISGSVVDLSGAPVAGVRITATDQYGNAAETVSKSGASDYGRFDI